LNGVAGTATGIGTRTVTAEVKVMAAR